MENIVPALTAHYLKKLPAGKEYFMPGGLAEYGFPTFLSERVRRAVYRKLKEELAFPQIRWSDLEDEQIRQVWDTFSGLVQEGARLPAGEAESLIRQALEETLALLLQPRKKLSDLLFGSEKSLDRSTLERRAAEVVVHRHLAAVPVKYMERKQLTSLTREQCERLISEVDERLSARYNLLDWADILEPLFKLFEDKVPSDLLRLFFEDKKRPLIARRFDLMEGGVSRSGLIEVLSDPQLLEGSEDERQPSTLFEDRPEMSGDPGVWSPAAEQVQEPEHVRPPAKEVQEPMQSDPEPTGGEQKDGEETVELYKAWTGGDEEPEVVDEESDDESAPLHSRFLFDQPDMNDYLGNQEGEEDGPEADDPKEVAGPEKKAEIRPAAEPAQEPLQSDPEPAGEEPEDVRAAGSGQKEFSEIEEAGPDDEEMEEDEDSIWKKFLVEEEPEEKPEDEMIEITRREPDDQGSPDEQDDPEAETLIDWFGDDAEYFRKGLFQGSDAAFEKAMEELSGIGQWKGAARYIQENIFDKRGVDMYEDVAVDFTDKMQSWYNRFRQEHS